MNRKSNFLVSTVDTRLFYTCRESKKVYDKTYKKVVQVLRKRGFDLHPDMSAPKFLRDTMFVGNNGILSVSVTKLTDGFEISFREMNGKNPKANASKVDDMAYIAKLHYKLCMKKICDCLAETGAEDYTKKKYVLAEDFVKNEYAISKRYGQKDMNFSLSDLDGTSEADYNSTDRDGKQILNGDFKYFRSYNGYLYRGKVYHNINNMWWVIVDKRNVRNIAAHNLFDLSDSDNRHREKEGKCPETYLIRKKAVKDTKSGTLIRELQRRGYKITKK